MEVCGYLTKRDLLATEVWLVERLQEAPEAHRGPVCFPASLETAML